MSCPGSTSATYTDTAPCQYYRKLCVSCYDNSGVTMVKVQSNGLPNHCYNSVIGYPTSIENEWTVAFNPNVVGVENYTAADVDTSAETDELLCDLQRTAAANMHSSSDYTLTTTRRRDLQPSGPPSGGSGSGPPSGDSTAPSGDTSSGSVGGALETAAGIALTGGYIFNALAGGNVDAVEYEADTLDVCLSHPSPTNEFHYHYWGACMKVGYGYHSSTVAPALCPDTSGCVSTPATITIAGTTNS